MNPNENQKMCKHGHHTWKLVAVILIALTILLANLGVWSWYTANIIWPIIIIVVAAVKLFGGCKGCEKK